MTDAANGERSGMSSTESVHATQTSAAVRLYFAHERAILGTLMVLLVLLAWEGLERGWWADAEIRRSGSSSSRSSSPRLRSSQRRPFVCSS
jgi:hypothetical protein